MIRDVDGNIRDFVGSFWDSDRNVGYLFFKSLRFWTIYGIFTEFFETMTEMFDFSDRNVLNVDQNFRNFDPNLY